MKNPLSWVRGAALDKAKTSKTAGATRNPNVTTVPAVPAAIDFGVGHFLRVLPLISILRSQSGCDAQ